MVRCLEACRKSHLHVQLIILGEVYIGLYVLIGRLASVRSKTDLEVR